MRGVAIGTVPIFKNAATKIHKIKTEKKTEKNSENTFHVKTRHFLVTQTQNLKKNVNSTQSTFDKIHPRNPNIFPRLFPPDI